MGGSMIGYICFVLYIHMQIHQRYVNIRSELKNKRNEAWMRIKLNSKFI